MKKKSVEKLINKIDIENNFDKINAQIDYDKYDYENETFPKRKVKPVLQFAMVVASIYVAILAFFAIDHISCDSYNKKVLERQANLYNVNNTEIYKLNSRKDYDEIVNKTVTFKTSLFDSVFNGKMLGGNLPTNNPTASFPTISIPDSSMIEDIMPGDPETGVDKPSNDNVTDTNVQTRGIDEADVAKCDGTYIYSLCNLSNSSNSYLEVFDLDGTLIASETIIENNSFYSTYFEIYVYEKTIVLLGNKTTAIYDFDGKKLRIKSKFEYGRYNTSRLYEDNLYLITNESLNLETQEYDNLYYDGCSNANYVYTIIKYNLNSKEYSYVSNLNGNGTCLYMSNSHIYLANHSYHSYFSDEGEIEGKQMTTVSIFDFDLNAVGAVRFIGTILNQFSMDEYNNYLRVVSTNTYSVNRNRINAISIYDLSSLEKVGYLNDGIGLSGHLVKSVTYNKDTCYVVTYQNTDPLYEIDLSDVTSPRIVSIYKAPGYSNYLHKFEIDGKFYLFGVGYDDNNGRKISIYHDDGEETTQIGEDFNITSFKGVDVELVVERRDINHASFNNHKALFVYNDGDYLYLGLKVTYDSYYIFKVDITADNVISIYKEINLLDNYENSRCFLVDGIIYVTSVNKIHKESFK